MEDQAHNVMPRKSLRNRIVDRLLILVLGIMTVVIVTVSFILLSALREEKITTLSENSTHAVKRMEQRIHSLNASVLNFSQNHFIINSLVHIQGREEYLYKMIEDFGKLASIHSISIVDYSGKMVHSNIPSPPDYQKVLYLRPALETAHSILQLSRDKKNIIMVEPVLHYDTPIGAVIAEVSIKSLISTVLPEEENSYYKLYSRRELIYSYNFDPKLSYVISPHMGKRQDDSKLNTINLEVEVGIVESVLLKPIWLAVFQLFGLSAIFFILTFILARRMGDDLAGPILKMIQKTTQSGEDPNQKYSPIGTEDELEILANALDSRDSQLWEYREHLEEQVNHRTRELTVAKEEAEMNARKIKEFVKDLGLKNRELQKARKKADQANVAKSEFLANMSHEIRTPLNAVIGFSEILNNLITDQRQRSFLTSIQTSGKSLLTLINDILDLSKIEAGKLVLRYEDTSIRYILDEIQQIFSLKLDEKALKFEVNISPDIPDVLILDEIRIRQVLLNLVGNAIKFTDQGGITITLTLDHIDSARSKLDLVIAVQDTGVGIEESQKEAIFNTFVQQEGQSTRKYGGTGLGLAITKRLVEMMNGEISLESAIGGGTTFFVRIHGVPVSAVKQITTEQKKDFNLREVQFAPATVLVVDDIFSNRKLIEVLMTQAGLTSIQAENGEQAVLMATEKQPDLILMDIRMPVMDGYQATQKLKCTPATKDIPVIALTASVKSSEKEKIFSMGFDGYLLKPIEANLLFNKLTTYLKFEKREVSEIKPDKPAYSEKITAESVAEIVDLKEFIQILKKDFMPKWEELSGALEISALEAFMEELQDLAAKHHSSCLSGFSKQIQTYIENFEFEELKFALAIFPDKIKELEQFMKE